MRDERLKSGFWLRALIRQMERMGGHAVVVKKGDEDAGAALLVLTDRMRQNLILRESAAARKWEPVPHKSYEGLTSYLERQKRYDPDLWIIECEVTDIATFDPQTLLSRKG